METQQLPNAVSNEKTKKLEHPTSKQSSPPDHISVLICTYRRPKMLAHLLEQLNHQLTHDQFTYSIVVVDNDPEKSANGVAHSFIDQTHIDVQYYHEPSKGLTYARNTSLEHSAGNYIAILDDDEVPEYDWLYQLYHALQKYDADAVFGSVRPRFEVDPPHWITKQNYFYWRDIRTETGAPTTHTATNNVLMRRDLITRYNLRFDHDFAFLGGEDQDFFFRLQNHHPGVKYINCKEAVVNEVLPSYRCDPDYIQKRNVLEGRGRVFSNLKLAESKINKAKTFVQLFIQFFSRFVATGISLPLLYIYDRALAKVYYHKIYYHIGILLALFGLAPYEDRNSIGLD